MSTLPLLEVQGVSKRFGGLLANDDVSFTVNDGEIVSIIGPNGAGKSTLFNCITGFYPPNSGRIVYRGKDITRFGADRICKLGIARTFQIVQIISDMTVLENVMTGAFLRSARRGPVRQRAEEVLQFTGLIEKRDAAATALTIADKKRLEVSMALATQPKLLMLDEAMAGLTPVELKEMMALIRKVRGRGITLVIVEHVMEAVMELSDRVIVITSGKKIVEGPPREIVVNKEVIQAYLGERYHAGN
ncbi:MAG TPA: ABC transporter ATP-binding protein [Candidatus Methylomirabilis sp.]|nr:ABC transporter ATP-binding protein [Candidatus Methylomirabilis sp.]